MLVKVFQTVSGDLHGASAASVSRLIYAVSSALVELSPTYIKFPSKWREINNTTVGFARISDFSSVLAWELWKRDIFLSIFLYI